MKFTILLLLITSLPFLAMGETKEEMLFNGNDLSNWSFEHEDSSLPLEAVWTVKEGGILVCSGAVKSCLRTVTEDYGNYVLTLQWCWPKPGNSGVLVHATAPLGKHTIWPQSLEVQLAHRSAGDFWTRRIKNLKASNLESSEWKGCYQKLDVKAEKPLGEWNDLEVICRDGEIIVKVNGELVNHATDCSDRSGAICLQSEKGEIHFRDIKLKPLDL